MIDLLFLTVIMFTLYIFNEKFFLSLFLSICLIGFYIVYRLTKKKYKKLDTLIYSTDVDPITELPNRQWIVKRVDHHLKENRSNAVVFIQFERFKQINDVFGEPFGDRFLVAVSKKLTNLLQPNWEIAKLHGSHFCIVMNDIDDRKKIKHWATYISEQMETKIKIENYEVHSNVRIGIAIGPEDGNCGDELIKNARIAICKETNCLEKIRFFHKEMMEIAQETWMIEDGLYQALLNDELVIHYQPQVDFVSGKTIGVEALIRWNHPLYGMISPGKFIPIAEKTGLIDEIGKWVLENACKQIKEWEKNGFSKLNMSVNVSIHQLISGDFVQTLLTVLEKTNIRPQQLTLEITESTLINDKKIIPMLHAMKELGVKLAIDDFGTGYSSLCYLAELPVDFIKIDRHFIDNISHNEKALMIVESIIEIADSLGARTIAEGVETIEQYELLKKKNCHYAQGYFISRPIEPSRIVWNLIQFKGKQRMQMDNEMSV